MSKSIGKNYKMVNDVPMATIYRGMTHERMLTLMTMLDKAFCKVYESDPKELLSNEQFDTLVNEEFVRMLNRAAAKAGWHAEKRASMRKHPSNRKVLVKGGK